LRTDIRKRKRKERPEKQEGGKKGGQVAKRDHLKHTEDRKNRFNCLRRDRHMNQYAMGKKLSQEDQQMSEQVAQQVQGFVQAFLELLDA
jgi:hypothetical protein